MQNYSPKEIPLSTFLSRSPTIPQADNRILEAQALIHSIQAEICQLKEYKNFCAVVSKLPHEILSLIFTVQTLEEDNCRDPLSHRVSWVCRRWRDIALSTPRLWNTICIGSQEPWVKLLLERSKAAPLHILESGPSTRFPPSLPIILTHSARIQRMHFPYEARHFLEPIFRESFPSLKLLHVSANFKPHAKELSPFNMPVLKDLTLSMDPLHLKRIPTHNLETLRIDLSPGYDPRKITTDDMFALLRQCPQLTSLFLHHAMQGGSIGPKDSSHEPIVLPYLTNIDLLADYISDLSIFVLLRAQRLRSVKAGSRRSASVEDVEQIVPYIFEALPKEASWWNVVAPIINTLDCPRLVPSWTPSSPESISVRMWRDITPQNPKFTDLPAVWLEIAGRGDFKTERRICELLPGRVPTVFVYNPSTRCCDAHDTTVVGLSAGLNVICLHVSSLDFLRQILSYPSTRDAPVGYPFPSLRHIRLFLRDADIKPLGRLTSHVLAVRATLQARRKVGYITESIAVTLESKATKSTLDQLRVLFDPITEFVEVLFKPNNVRNQA